MGYSILQPFRQIKIVTFQTIQRDCKSRHFGKYFLGGKLSSATGLPYSVKAKCGIALYLPLNFRISEDMLRLVSVDYKNKENPALMSDTTGKL